jgi:hypothetical protein
LATAWVNSTTFQVLTIPEQIAHSIRNAITDLSMFKSLELAVWLSIVATTCCPLYAIEPAVEIDSLASHLADDSSENVLLTSFTGSDCVGSGYADGSGCVMPCGDGGCGQSTCCGECCGGGGFLGGLIKPSDHGFDGFISPMTNPVFFEDPRTLTEARIIFLHHTVPNSALGGEINLYAMQLRAALTDRLSFIATKDGFVVSSNPLIRDGWADVSAGLKYNLFVDHEAQRLLSAGASYEIPLGSTRTRQGNGGGMFHTFLSGAAKIGDRNHWISGAGLLLPADRSEESSMSYWSNHLDHRFRGTNFYALVECNWYHYMGSGTAFPLPLEGGDLFNLGSVGVAGNDIVTGAFGGKYKPSGNLELGIAWENPLTDRRDVLKNRLTVDCILRY